MKISYSSIATVTKDEDGLYFLSRLEESVGKSIGRLVIKRLAHYNQSLCKTR